MKGNEPDGKEYHNGVSECNGKLSKSEELDDNSSNNITSATDFRWGLHFSSPRFFG